MSLPSNQQQQNGAQWHWGEGTKYALEAGKSLILINGAAAISILTFVGNHPSKTYGIFCAINLFAFGSLFGAIFFGVSYEAQLWYGNGLERRARIWHWRAYIFAAVSALLFVLGMCAATQSLLQG